MKCYVNEGQLRLVGKGWEIRRHLQTLLRTYGSETRVADYAHACSTAAPFQQAPRCNAAIIPFPLQTDRTQQQLI